MPLPVRRRNATFAIKAEATQGVDAFGGAAPSLATDYLKADFNPTWTQQVLNNPELTGTLDESPSIAGGTKVSVQITCMLKGSGSAGVAPQWGKLMQICGWAETLSTGVAAAAASAGSVNSATLGAGYAATAQAYRGMPVILSGNPAPSVLTLITDYTAAKVATFGHTFAAPLDGTTMVNLVPNALYKPTSDPAVEKSATIVLFQDGLAWKLLGCKGTWKIDVNGGGVGTIVFTVSGTWQDPTAVALPSGAVFDATQPPVFRNGMCRLNGLVARVSKASFDAGGTIFEPENPEAPEGFDPPVITKRNAKGTFDPLMNIADTIARVASFKSGAPQTTGVSFGTVAGNRIGIMSPRVQYTAFGAANRSDLMAENLSFECAMPDASIFLTVS